MEQIKIEDKGNERKYFTIVPRIVWALSRTHEDFALWIIIKSIAGDDGECYLSTDNLAIMAMMSKPTVIKSRNYLIEVGLLHMEMKKPKYGTQKIMHLTIPDIMRKNVEWSEKYKSIQERLEWKDNWKIHYNSGKLGNR